MRFQHLFCENLFQKKVNEFFNTKNYDQIHLQTSPSTPQKSCASPKTTDRVLLRVLAPCPKSQQAY